MQQPKDFSLCGDGTNHKCSACKKRFSIKVGTIFENSKISLKKWFTAVLQVTTPKKSLSSLQLSRDINVTQKLPKKLHGLCFIGLEK
ncbi:MAG: hypothetical protein AB8U97_00665 [Rickettsia endosymbiont of Haemaphysalis japonica]